MTFYWRPHQPPPYQPPMQTGWKCPECGKVNAPWMPYCVGKHSATVTVTTTSASEAAHDGENERLWEAVGLAEAIVDSIDDPNVRDVAVSWFESHVSNLRAAASGVSPSSPEHESAPGKPSGAPDGGACHYEHPRASLDPPWGLCDCGCERVRST